MTDSALAPGFTCPRCGSVSHNPTDRTEGYCGRCHDWTGPEGSYTERIYMTDQPTTERLAEALQAAGAPAVMIERARQGYYDDYKSPLPMPQAQLRTEALALGLTTIAAGVVAGEWDGTKEESDAWAASPDGQATFREFYAPQPNRAQRRHPK